MTDARLKFLDEWDEGGMREGGMARTKPQGKVLLKHIYETVRFGTRPDQETMMGLTEEVEYP